MGHIAKHIVNNRKRLGMHVSNIRFCPMCSCESLFRDSFRERHDQHVEYWCGTCGFGFRIQPSRRVQEAEELTRRDRMLRMQKDFIERGLPPETLAYIREHGAESVLWRRT